MSNDEYWYVQHNFKVGDDLVNIRGVNVAHLRKNVQEYAEAVAEIAQLKANIAGGQALGQVVQPTVQQPQQAPPPQQPAPQSAWGQPAPQQQPQGGFGGPQNGSPHPNGQQCTQCGSVLQYKAGTSKAGRDYKMWTCPNGRSRDDGHVTEFIR